MKLQKRLVMIASALALSTVSCGGGDDALDAAGGEISAAAIPLLIASQGFTAFKAGLVPQSAGAITPPGLGGVIPFVAMQDWQQTRTSRVPQLRAQTRTVPTMTAFH